MPLGIKQCCLSSHSGVYSIFILTRGSAPVKSLATEAWSDRYSWYDLVNIQYPYAALGTGWWLAGVRICT